VRFSPLIHLPPPRLWTSIPRPRLSHVFSPLAGESLLRPASLSRHDRLSPLGFTGASGPLRAMMIYFFFCERFVEVLLLSRTCFPPSSTDADMRFFLPPLPPTFFLWWHSNCLHSYSLGCSTFSRIEVLAFFPLRTSAPQRLKGEPCRPALLLDLFPSPRNAFLLLLSFHT